MHLPLSRPPTCCAAALQCLSTKAHHCTYFSMTGKVMWCNYSQWSYILCHFTVELFQLSNHHSLCPVSEHQWQGHHRPPGTHTCARWRWSELRRGGGSAKPKAGGQQTQVPWLYSQSGGDNSVPTCSPGKRKADTCASLPMASIAYVLVVNLAVLRPGIAQVRKYSVKSYLRNRSDYKFCRLQKGNEICMTGSLVMQVKIQ